MDQGLFKSGTVYGFIVICCWDMELVFNNDDIVTQSVSIQNGDLNIHLLTTIIPTIRTTTTTTIPTSFHVVAQKSDIIV